MAVYFLSGFGGILFSCLVSDELSVGASTAIYGIMGSLLGVMILNWNALDFPGSPRNQYTCFLVVIIVFSLIGGFGGNASNIDVYGHVGGLITGIIAGYSIFKAQDTTRLP